MMFMVSSLLSKSFGDLKRRRTRTFLTVLTIALGVAALGMFAVVPLMDENMFHQMERCNMYDIRCEVNNLPLMGENMRGLEDLPNVNGVEGKYIYATRMYIGDRRADAFIVGVEDFSAQKVDRIVRTSGSYPSYMELLTDGSNGRVKLFNGESGDPVRLYDANGMVRELNITGSAYNNDYSQWPGWGTVVLYTTIGTARELANGTGYIILSFDLDKAGKGDLERTVEDIQNYLEQNSDFVAFASMPVTNEEGNWPGKDEFSDMANFFYVLTFMTMGCSLFLISNTMHTMITEQRKEICQMKAVGATRAQVVRTYLTTSFILGTVGALIGTILGILVSYGMLWFLSSSFYGVTPNFLVHVPTMLLCLVLGVLATLVATLPALVQGVRVPVREGMESAGISANFGSSFIDRALMRNKLLPRTFQMGFRNASRKKGRSISTILQITLAVGMFLGVVTIGYSLSETVKTEFDYFTYDIQAMGSSEGAKAITPEMISVVTSIEGVANAEPVIWSQGRLAGEDVLLLGYPHDTISYDINRTLQRGRWFNEAEERSAERVVVISKMLSKARNKDIDDLIDIGTPMGTFSYRVVGVQKSQMMNGHNVFIPIPTIQNVTNNPYISGFAVVTSDRSHKEIDRVASEIEDRMLEKGLVVSSGILYVFKEQNLRGNQNIINLMLAVGALIVLITSIGLVSTLTMNIIERTREIGMLRCIGSSSFALRKIFGSEGMTLAFFGALLGIPAGLGVGLFIEKMMEDIIKLELFYEFPLAYVVIAFVMTLILTLVVIQFPLRRASKLRPGDAIRYA